MYISRAVGIWKGVRPQWAAKEPRHTRDTRILERSRWDAHGSALGISASRA